MDWFTLGLGLLVMLLGAIGIGVGMSTGERVPAFGGFAMFVIGLAFLAYQKIYFG